MFYPSLNSLIGNKNAADKAQRMIQSGKIPQSLLITGPCPLTAQEFAKAFAGSLLTRQDEKGLHLAKLNSGNHPDLYVLHPEGKGNQYTIETIRQFNDLLFLPPTEAFNKAFILLDAHRMLPVSSNALLKSIEEPARDAVVILVTTAPELLLPTIVSRCQTIALQPLTEQEMALWLEKAGVKTTLKCLRLAEGSQSHALSLVSGINFQETLLPLLQTMSQTALSYTQIHEAAQKLAESIDVFVKQREEKTESQSVEEMQYWSPQQRQQQEKKEDGLHASLIRESFQLLCIHVLGFFRDLEAHTAQVPNSHYYYPELFIPSGTLSLSPACPTVEMIEARIHTATALLDRFTPLKTCIEALFSSTPTK